MLGFFGNSKKKQQAEQEQKKAQPQVDTRPRNIDGELLEKDYLPYPDKESVREESIASSFGTTDLDKVFRRYAPDMIEYQEEDQAEYFSR